MADEGLDYSSQRDTPRDVNGLITRATDIDRRVSSVDWRNYRDVLAEREDRSSQIRASARHHFAGKGHVLGEDLGFHESHTNLILSRWDFFKKATARTRQGYIGLFVLDNIVIQSHESASWSAPAAVHVPDFIEALLGTMNFEESNFFTNSVHDVVRETQLNVGYAQELLKEGKAQDLFDLCQRNVQSLLATVSPTQFHGEHMSCAALISSPIMVGYFTNAVYDYFAMQAILQIAGLNEGRPPANKHIPVQ